MFTWLLACDVSLTPPASPPPPPAASSHLLRSAGPGAADLVQARLLPVGQQPALRPLWQRPHSGSGHGHTQPRGGGARRGAHRAVPLRAGTVDECAPTSLSLCLTAHKPARCAHQLLAFPAASPVVVLPCLPQCAAIARFPRYNDPVKLLETRRGRCGEVSSRCPGLMCSHPPVRQLSRTCPAQGVCRSSASQH